jgi:uncharacterized protein
MPSRKPSIPFCGVAVMAKASAAGLSKTRLCPPLTFEEAASFNTAFLKDIVENIAAAAAAEASLACAFAYGPPKTEAFFREHFPRSLALYEVWRPNFGDCLSEAMTRLFASGHRAACVLNSDSPTLPASLLVEMNRILAQPGDRAVLGPSADGGYYLLACKKLHRRLFEQVDWSTEKVFAQTMERAAEIGLPVVVLDEWYDVDDASSLSLLVGELLDGRRFSASLRSSSSPHSTALLKSMFANTNLGERLDQFLRNNAAAVLREAAA